MELEDQFREAREKMVREQMLRRGIHNPRLLDVMRRVPRHEFIPAPVRHLAYEDGPVAIGLDQTISQPYMVAAMTDLLELEGGETVLEIGTGSGYQAAVLSQMAAYVHTIERHPQLAHQARAVLDELGYHNIEVHIGDGTFGWPPAAPYPAIVVTAGAPDIPEPLFEQLAEGGRLVIPVGRRDEQHMERWRKAGGRVYRETLFPVAFVPLLGRFGWEEEVL